MSTATVTFEATATDSIPVNVTEWNDSLICLLTVIVSAALVCCVFFKPFRVLYSLLLLPRTTCKLIRLGTTRMLKNVRSDQTPPRKRKLPFLYSSSRSFFRKEKARRYRRKSIQEEARVPSTHNGKIWVPVFGL